MQPTYMATHSTSQLLPFDEIEMWHGHPNKYWR